LRTAFNCVFGRTDPCSQFWCLYLCCARMELPYGLIKICSSSVTHTALCRKIPMNMLCWIQIKGCKSSYLPLLIKTVWTCNSVPRCRREDNIKMDLQTVGCGGMDWTDLAQDRDRWWAFVKVVMNLQGT
jgi:hypothetical protein